MPLKQTFSEFFPPPPVFTEKELPSLSGKAYLITGGAAGIGKELARMLFSADATVYIAGRSLSNIEKATKDIVDNPVKLQRAAAAPATGKIVPIVFDLADLPSIKPAIEKIKQQTTKLDVAFFNAGVMVPPRESKTKQGYELQWGTNVVGHFVLQKLLLPLLLASARESGEARVVWVSSDASSNSPSPDGICWNDINSAKLDSWTTYGQGKAGDIILAAETARRYAKDNIIAASLNPGHLKTDLQRHWFSNSCITSLISAPLMYEPRYGALTELFVGLSEKVNTEKNGQYFIPWGREGKRPKHIEKGLENGSGSRLWDLLEKETEQYV
jgi:retinol dehydrogenase-12